MSIYRLALVLQVEDWLARIKEDVTPFPATESGVLQNMSMIY